MAAAVPCPTLALAVQIPMSLACGSVAGLVSSTATFPLDLVRRRMQLQGQAGEQRQYTGYAHAFQTIVRREGFKGLYSGEPGLTSATAFKQLSLTKAENSTQMLAATVMYCGTSAESMTGTALSPWPRHIDRAADARYNASVASCLQASFQSTTKSFLAWPSPSAPMSS